jgi:hypothetical protein
MLNGIMAVFSAIQNLVENGGKRVQQFCLRMMWTAAFIVVTAAVILTAVGCFLFGLYQYLVTYLPTSGAAFLVSLAAVVLAILFAGVLKWRSN